MKQKILFIILIGMNFGINAQENKIESTGNVGIGTTSPNENLEVSNDSGGVLRLSSTSINSLVGDLAGKINFYKSDPSFSSGIVSYIQSRSTNLGGHYSLDFATGTANNDENSINTRMSINYNGNVGIGIINPKSILHLYNGSSGGDPHSYSSLTVEDSDHSVVSILTPNNKKAYFGFADPEDDYVGGMEYNHTTNQLIFRANNHTIDLIINSNGNIGIGTTDTKDFKLGVNGKIAAEEVKVALYTNWSDFVFKKDYNLPTLNEVENYIKEKGHLKDIPSEKDVRENGFYLGEMDSKLLQKIEELTLYTIQQEEKIKRLELMNEKLLELQHRLEKLEKK